MTRQHPPRLRLATVTITPTVYLDDGEDLTPVTVTPFVVEAARLDQLPALIRAGLAEHQQRIDGQTGPD
jgi:hypothetical protein